MGCFLSYFFAFNAKAVTYNCQTLLEEAPKKAVDGLIKGEYVFDYEKYKVKNPYLDPLNQEQRAFLESLGAVLTDDKIVIESVHEAALRVNKMVDELILNKTIDKADAVYWADAYVLKDQTLGFVKYGESPPNGATPFLAQNFGIYKTDSSGRNYYRQTSAGRPFSMDTPAEYLISDMDYNRAVANGFVPIFRSYVTTQFVEARDGVPYPKETILLHDLAHMGGFIMRPEMMRFFKETSKALVKKEEKEDIDANQISHQLISDPDIDLFREVNETMVTLSKGAEDELITILKSVSFDEFALMSDLVYLSNSLLDFYLEFRAPYGGAVRTASMVEVVEFPTDRLFFELRSALKSYEDQLEVGYQSNWYNARMRYREYQLIRSSKEKFKKILHTFINSLRVLSKITAKDYFKILTHEEVSKDLEELLCGEANSRRSLVCK